jgi:hypothetical protein
MEGPVLHDLHAQRNKQVSDTYVVTTTMNTRYNSKENEKKIVSRNK